jgi:hypothetical protein
MQADISFPSAQPILSAMPSLLRKNAGEIAEYPIK